MREQEVTAAVVRELLRYDAATGALEWRPRKGRGCRTDLIGTRAGSPHKDGYLHVALKGKKYLAHRLVWLHTKGVWPTGEIDHINGDRSDDRIENLRDVSKAVNQQNQRKGKGVCASLGVDLIRRTGMYRARITVKGKVKHLGYFEFLREAERAYLSAKRELHEGCTI